MRRKFTVAVVASLIMGVTGPLPSTAAPVASAPSTITLRSVPDTFTATAFVLHGRIRGTGGANDKTVLLQQYYSRRWHTTATLRRQDDGRYRFRRQATQAGEYVFRTLVERRGARLGTSAVRTVTVTAPPQPPPPPTSTIAPTGPPPPIDPPSVGTANNPTNVIGVEGGALYCRAKELVRVTAPTINTAAYDISGITDFYVDYLWQWSGTQWVGVGWGPLAWRQRGYGTRWTRYDNGVVVDEFLYTAVSGRWYAVTQWFYDGQRGNYWPQVHATYIGGRGEPFCLAT